MMFHAHTAFAMELVALIAAVGLLVLSGREMAYKGLAKLVGYFAIAAAALAMLCTLYYSVRYWEDGYFKTPMTIHMRSGTGKMDGRGMMDRDDRIRRRDMMDDIRKRMMDDEVAPETPSPESPLPSREQP